MAIKSHGRLPHTPTQRATSLYLVRATTSWNDFWRQYNNPSPAAFSFTTHHPLAPIAVTLPDWYTMRTPHWQILAISEVDLNSQVPPLIPSLENTSEGGSSQTVREAWRAASDIRAAGAELCIEIGLTPHELRTLVTDGHLDIEALKVALALMPAPANATAPETVTWYTFIIDTITAAHQASQEAKRALPRGR